MDNSVLTEINNLKKEMNCSEKYRCFSECFTNPNAARFNALFNNMECFSSELNNPDFCSQRTEDSNCSCPLRKIISVNFSELTDKNY